MLSKTLSARWPGARIAFLGMPSMIGFFAEKAFAHCLENSVTGTHRYLAEQDKPSSYEGTTSAADAANREGYCGDWLKLGGAIVAKR